MSDDRPSIAELQTLSSQPRWDEDDVTQAATALPVLLEIAATALASRRAVHSEQDARDQYAALQSLDAALARVRQ